MLRVLDASASAIALQQVQAVLELREPELELVVLTARDEAEILRDLLDAHARAFPHADGIPPPAAGELVELRPPFVHYCLGVSGLGHADASGGAAAVAGGARPPSRSHRRARWGRAPARALPLRPRPAARPRPARPRRQRLRRHRPRS